MSWRPSRQAVRLSVVTALSRRHRRRSLRSCRRPDGAGVRVLGLEDVDGGVHVAVGALDDAVQALAAVGGPPGHAEGAVGDRGEQRVVADPLQQVDRLRQHLPGALDDEAAGAGHEVLGERAAGVA